MKKLENAKEMDVYDRKIMFELGINARASASSIAKKIRLPKETVNFRIKRLLKKGYIERFYAIINASRFGYQYYRIFFKLNKITPETEEKTIKYIRNEKSCANLRIMEGTYDLCFVSMHRHLNELKEFLHKFSKHFGDYIMEKSMHNIITSYKLNQKVLFPGKTEKIVFYQGKTNEYGLDSIDLKVIKLLSVNARMKLTDLAQTIKKDPRVINYHIKKLEQKGIIVGYFTALNLKLVGREFVQIDINLKNPDIIGAVIDFFDTTNTCIFAYEMLGKYDLSLELYVENDSQLRNILAEFKRRFFDHYMSYDVSRIFREFVINWSPFDAYGEQEKVKLAKA